MPEPFDYADILLGVAGIGAFLWAIFLIWMW